MKLTIDLDDEFCSDGETIEEIITKAIKREVESYIEKLTDNYFKRDKLVIDEMIQKATRKDWDKIEAYLHKILNTRTSAKQVADLYKTVIQNK
jgi:ribosomal protein S17E